MFHSRIHASKMTITLLIAKAKRSLSHGLDPDHHFETAKVSSRNRAQQILKGLVLGPNLKHRSHKLEFTVLARLRLGEHQSRREVIMHTQVASRWSISAPKQTSGAYESPQISARTELDEQSS